MASKNVKKILIVDDNPPIQELFKEFFEDRGFTAAVARNGSEGIEKYKAMQPDIVLMDVRMPVMNGYESSKGIKNFDPLAKILLVTGHPSDQLARKSLAEGFVASILPKPCALENLYARVCSTLQG
jgi:two-component system chemotaxis response regulator CheY